MGEQPEYSFQILDIRSLRGANILFDHLCYRISSSNTTTKADKNVNLTAWRSYQNVKKTATNSRFSLNYNNSKIIQNTENVMPPTISEGDTDIQNLEKN